MTTGPPPRPTLLETLGRGHRHHQPNQRRPSTASIFSKPKINIHFVLTEEPPLMFSKPKHKK